MADRGYSRRESSLSDSQPSDDPQYGRRGDSDQNLLDRYGRRSPPPAAPASNPAASGPQENLCGGPTGVLVKRLADCCVKSENDAKLASDVISVLMKCLKEYHQKIGDPNAVLLIHEANIKFNMMKALQNTAQSEPANCEPCQPQNDGRPPYDPAGAINFTSANHTSARGRFPMRYALPLHATIGLSSQVVPPSRSPTGFSGFSPAEHYLSSDDCVSQNDGRPDRVLLQCEVSDGIDQHVADMVNHIFAHGLREEEYKEILEDAAAKRPDNCHALVPVDCNLQVLDAMKIDAKKVDFRLKDVGKDIITAATILTKSLTVLDKIAQTSQPDVAQEVGMLNGALALLGHANHKNNLARRFIIKREINHKYAHLCSHKVPMTRLLFGDDVSLSAKHTEESEKLRSKIAPRKPLSTSKFGPGKFRGSSGRLPYRGFMARFHPYGQRTHGPRSEHRQSFSRQGPETKNSRGRGHNPRQ